MRRASQIHKEQTIATRAQPRSRDEKKLPDPGKSKTSEDVMDASKPPSSEEAHDSKSVKESDTSQSDKIADVSDVTDVTSVTGTSASQPEDNKRAFSEIEENANEDVTNEDETKRKKPKTTPQRSAGQKGPNKQTPAATKTATSLKVADCPSPKPVVASSSDAEVDDGKTDLKVPPLKIVIPQSSSEQEVGSNRNGKNSSQRSHQALPYVVTSSNSEVDKDVVASNASSPTEITPNVKTEDKKESTGTDDQRAGHQRVLRSSHRSGSAPQGSTDRSSNNSSPQLQRSNSPSPTASPSTTLSSTQTETTIHNTTASTTTTSTTITTSTTTTSKISDTQVPVVAEVEPTVSVATTVPSTATTTSSTVELHPRKRKMKQSKDTTAPVPSEQLETPAVSEVHPYEQSITNGYQLFLNIRKQIEKRRKSLFPVQPKPPQGFSDYLLNTCTYVLAGKAPTVPNITLPTTLPAVMAEIFTEQEKERYRLRMQHVIEKEKMVLSVEQEILRVHGRAARALANHSLPFSACTILRDEEVYNLITPEQEEKDRNARSRYNGRLFLSWLQDLDDKWEKIKERMILRHHNEAESLHAVQKMDWGWKLKELNLCDAKARPNIDEAHVPMVDVSDELNLLIIESGP